MTETALGQRIAKNTNLSRVSLFTTVAPDRATPQGRQAL